MIDRHHVRLRVDVKLIHSNGKETMAAQHWADVPLSSAEQIKRNATASAIEAVRRCQLEASPTVQGDE